MRPSMIATPPRYHCFGPGAMFLLGGCRGSDRHSLSHPARRHPHPPQIFLRRRFVEETPLQGGGEESRHASEKQRLRACERVLLDHMEEAELR